MNPKTMVIVAGSLVVVAFLLGFFPQYLKSRNLENQLDSIRPKLQADDVDLLVGYIYLQTNLKNYGLASQYSTTFFDRARATAGQASDANRQKFLQLAFSKQDSVVSALAKGDPGSEADVQELFQSALETTATGWTDGHKEKGNLFLTPI
jgi:hypothetical protein